MHPALLIDEILQEIFDICLHDKKGSLCSIARCCTAWKDLALDRIWRQLDSAMPLLCLIPGTEINKCRWGLVDVYFLDQSPDFSRFLFYAHRIKHISCTHNISTHPSISTISPPNMTGPLLPNLITATFGIMGWGKTQNALCLSRKLRGLDITLSYNRSRRASPPQTSQEASQLATKLLSDASTNGTLERLSVRGCLTWQGQKAIISSVSLRVLTLHASVSLSGSTLAALLSLPFLRELDVHADHISADDLEDNFRAMTVEKFFPSLEKLSIRAHVPLIDVMLQRLQKNTLRNLHIILQQSATQPSFWHPILEAIGSNFSKNLKQLTIENDIDLYEDNINTSFTPGFLSALQLSIDDLRPLKPSRLRSFRFITSIPLNIGDKDIDDMVRWWPELQHLSLGEISGVQSNLLPRMTVDCLVSLAKLPNLRSLTLSVDAGTRATAKGTGEKYDLRRTASIHWRQTPIIPDLACLRSSILSSSGVHRNSPFYSISWPAERRGSS